MTDTTRMQLLLPPEASRAAKIRALETGSTLSEYVATLIRIDTTTAELAERSARRLSHATRPIDAEKASVAASELVTAEKQAEADHD